MTVRKALAERRKALEAELAVTPNTDIVALVSITRALKEYDYFLSWLDARSVKPAQEAQP